LIDAFVASDSNIRQIRLGLVIFWKGGKLPDDLRDKLQRVAEWLPIEVYATKFSDDDLRNAQDEVRDNAFKNGACAGGAAYGSDSVKFTTDGDPAHLNIPQHSSNGVPITVIKGGCATAL
jgi:hypothetical protein